MATIDKNIGKNADIKNKVIVDTPERPEPISPINPAPAQGPDCGPGIDPNKLPPITGPKTPIDPRVPLYSTNKLKK